MLYINRDFEIKEKEYENGNIMPYISIGLNKREVIIPLPKTFIGRRLLERGLYKNLTINYSTNTCKPRINYGDNGKYIFLLLDSKEYENIDSTIEVEYEQFRATCLERVITITSTNDDSSHFWESSLIKVPNGKRVRYVRINYGNRTSYVVIEKNDTYEISKLPKVLKEDEFFMWRFDGESDLRPLKEIVEEMKSSTGFRKHTLQYIIDYRR